MVKMIKFGLASGLMALASCQQADSSPSAVGGLLRSDATFVMSANRCIISILFDNYRIRIPATGATVNPDRSFTVSGGKDRTVEIILRGAFVADEGSSAKIRLGIGDQSSERDLTPSDTAFQITFDGRLGAETPVKLHSEVRGSNKQSEALLDIDSADVSISSPTGDCR